MSALYRAWLNDQAHPAEVLATYRRWLAIDRARARHLGTMFRTAGYQPFEGYEQRLAEYRAACRRARRWLARIQQITAAQGVEA